MLQSHTSGSSKPVITWVTPTSCINKALPPPGPRVCSYTNTQTLGPYQNGSKHRRRRRDNLFMYGNVYEADHKLQVTYGFFPPRGGGATGRWMHGRSQCQGAHCCSMTSERARSMSDQCCRPWREAGVQHHPELCRLPPALVLSAGHRLSRHPLSHHSLSNKARCGIWFPVIYSTWYQIRHDKANARVCFYSFITGFKLELLPSLNRTLMDVVPAEGPLIVRWSSSICPR